MECLSFFFGKLREFCFIQCFAFSHRSEADGVGVPVYSDATLMSFTFYCLYRPVVTAVERIINRRFLLLIGRVLQNSREAGNQLINQFSHQTAEVAGLLGKQCQNFWFTRIVEVVYIAPDVRRFLALGFAF